ncbi:MAG: ABC transporter permease [Candidatus Dojkabacteria bacterium]
MKLYSILKQSFRSILSNKGRSFLTVLGVIIGIGSVIGLIALGNGVQASITDQISGLGSTNITVMSGSSLASRVSENGVSQRQQTGTPGAGLSTPQTLTKEDLQSLDQVSTDLVKNISGTVSSNAIFKLDAIEERFNVAGVSPRYFQINDLPLSGGKYLDLDDIDRNDNVIILGDSIAHEFFDSTDIIDKTITVQNTEFTIIGVLAKKEESNFSFNNPNSEAFIPDFTALSLFKTNYYNSFTVQAVTSDTVEQAKSQIEDIILKNHNIEDKSLADFSLTTAGELLSTVSQITGVLTSLLAGIAAISLLVGGIGIMNIMLVSVTERTREIGLRKAVGAQTTDILIQFLIEAVILTLLGGIFGILLGYAISIGASRLLDFSGVVTMDAILLAVGVSSLIGIIFGIYPAAKAARLNPIDALRYE